MLRRLTLHTLKSLALAITATAVFVVGTEICEPDAEASPQVQSSQTRDVDWYYWRTRGPAPSSAPAWTVPERRRPS